MPNTFLKAERIAAAALGLLRDELVLGRTVARMGAADFRGAVNDTVNVRVPTILTAREYAWRNDRTNPIVLDSLAEETIPVTLNKHPYSAVAVTDEELTLDIVDFGAQVLSPQVIAVAEKLESYLGASMATFTSNYADIPFTPTAGVAAFYNAAIEARRVLNEANIPREGRFIAVGSSVEAEALKEDAFRKADESGSTDALREAIIGRVAGFTVLGTNELDPEAAVAYHRSAFVLANVAPLVPAGVAMGQGVEQDGFALRWIRDYDTARLQDRSVVSSFGGAASVNDERDVDGTLAASPANIRAVKITLAS